MPVQVFKLMIVMTPSRIIMPLSLAVPVPVIPVSGTAVPPAHPGRDWQYYYYHRDWH